MFGKYLGRIRSSRKLSNPFLLDIIVTQLPRLQAGHQKEANPLDREANGERGRGERGGGGIDKNDVRLQ